MFTFLSSKQKRKRQSAYDGIRYDKLEGNGDILKSPAKPKNIKLLISADDVELNHEKLQMAYEDLHTNDCEPENKDEDDDEDDDESEETRFINSKRSSFYTSSERT